MLKNKYKNTVSILLVSILTPKRWKVTKVIVVPRNCIFFLEQPEVKEILLHFFDLGEDWPEMDGVPGSQLKFSIKMEMRKE